MRLWVDDVRPAPDGWKWARTNDQAKELFLTGRVVECSLDHDMGLHSLEIEETDDWDKIIELTYALTEANQLSAETGLDLVHWMIEHDRVPAKITIHSWNSDGAMAMAQRLARFGHEVVVQPFQVKK